MRLHRLSLLGNLLSAEQREELNIAQQQLENVKREWLTAYTTKITYELGLHINEWKQFLNECQQDRTECRDLYPSVAEKRVMAQNLADEARELNVLTPEVEKRLREIDLQVQGYFKSGSFIWDQRLQQAYPQNQYGFLYVSM